ncbi:hypothetical protein OESDEN_15459 [Oesophagostomum dentatum]|uniref:VWFA domain-containing protein n=1 Tax=Oesophagostomum dentatum TaxID=61180 RepID=A0A0B1SMQ9_OESDE|nr:hypothetical protein OESDEN_15459 [Oesophagostomum dentatum]
MDTTEATLTNVTFDTTEATPTSEMTDDAEVTPSSELTDNTEAAPTSETTDNTEGALTNATMDTTELISTDETTDTTEATPISETTDDAEATPTSETTDSTEATPADETTDNTDAALTNATMDTTEATPTSAAAPSIPTTDQPTQHINEQCNKAAHFDVEKGGCVCNNPEMDAKRRNPIKYRRYSEGDVCYSCQASNSTTAIVFILDESGTVKRSGWRAQKTFMRQLLNLMGDIKVGVVVIAGNSYVAVPLDDYRKNKWAIE